MKGVFRFDYIANYIKKKGLLKQDFCKMCGVSVAEFDKMWLGDMTFTFDTLCKIAEYLKMEIYEFFLPYPIPAYYD